MSLPRLQCQIFLPEQGLKDGELTVGAVMSWNCLGEQPIELQPGAGVDLVPRSAAEVSPWAFRILSSEEDGTEQVQLEVTSYVVGTHNLADWQLVSGSQSWHLVGPEIEVVSVIEVEPGETPEPFGPFGPVGYGLPLSWIISAAALLVLLVSFLGVLTYVWAGRRHLKELLGRHGGPAEAMNDFSRFLRQKRRTLPVDSAEKERLLAELEQELRVYLLRRLRINTFKTPMAEWPRRIERSYPVLGGGWSESLRVLCREIVQAQTSGGKLSESDLQQLLSMSVQVAEGLEAALSKDREGAV